MIVLVANSLPPAVRGKLKLWFEEPRPNVFVSGITDALADNVVDMLMEYLSHLNFECAVFPTPVGVFPRKMQKFLYFRCLPHARGGVSSYEALFLSPPWSSPRPWGCFYFPRA